MFRLIAYQKAHDTNLILKSGSEEYNLYKAGILADIS